MSNKSPRKKKGQRQAQRSRPNTALSGHKKQGNLLRPPFNTLDNLRLHVWLRDAFPDYLWVCSLLASDLDRGTKVVTATMDDVNETLDRVLGNKAPDRPVLDGSLSSWEKVPEKARAPVLDNLKAAGGFELAFPEEFAHVLGMYPGAPGSWLIEPWRQEGLSIDPERAERSLNQTIRESIHGQSPVATKAKAMALRGLLEAEKIVFGADVETVNLLSRYPGGLTPDELAQVESFIRAAFGISGLREAKEEPDSLSPRAAWAQTFWRSNWRVFPCRISDAEELRPSGDQVRASLDEFTGAVDRLWHNFDDVALTADPDLFNPDRYEVLTGITARCLRTLVAAIESPASWTAEHSAPLVRSMAEALITISWLLRRDDAALYARFKDYGRGRLKLLKLHLEEHADGLDQVPADLAEQLSRLDALVNEDLSEEFQDINLSGTFSGVDIRKMAYEVGLHSVDAGVIP